MHALEVPWGHFEDLASEEQAQAVARTFLSAELSHTLGRVTVEPE